MGTHHHEHRRVGLRLAAGFVGAVGVASIVTCYAPTELTVEITTDLACQDVLRVAIFTGTSTTAEAVTSASMCSDTPPRTFIGTIVVTPSGSRDGAASLRVVLAKGGAAPESCAKGSADCIEATRSFSFFKHESLKLPVVLFKDCLGKVCPENETCVAGGRCVSNNVVCVDGTCDVPPNPPTQGDGGASGDGSIINDAAPDRDAATKTCIAPNGTGVIATATDLPGPGLAAASSDAFYFIASPKLLSGKVVKVLKSTGAQTDVFDAFGPTGSGPLKITTSRVSGGAVFAHEISAGALTWRQIEIEGVVQPITVPDSAFVDFAAPVTTDPTAPLLYVLTNANVWSLKATTSTAFETAVTMPNAGGLAVDSQALYVSDTMGVRVHAIGSAALLGTLPLVPINAGSSVAFGSNETSIFALGGKKNAGVLKARLVRLTGVTDAPLLDTIDLIPLNGNQMRTASLTADKTHVYWTDGTGIHRTTHVGVGTPTDETVVASTGATFAHVVVDDDCLYYWTQTLGGGSSTPAELRIMTKPKP